ncbi:TonB-dependent vitamin B12 receptor [Thioalkalicoccus limnaeus]|uniref:TonB-dependent vitamin B12 receptor n=1 Tax=Thioalkalicoccus limnaeus TaxID=120681 RepID=A0ABV4B9J2_9GAMM
MHPTLPSAVGLLVVIPALVVAQAATEMDPIIVTATRTAQTAEATLASVTVITRSDLERRQIRSLPDALRGVPGLALANNGGRGKTTSVFIRGSESDQILVLIDGIKVGSATLGTTAFEQIPIEFIDRIEVVRGPRSSLYGSEAIGGVIQIFTREGGTREGGGPLTPRFSIGAGSYDTASISGGLSGGGQDAWFDLGVSLEDTKGFDACRGRETPFAGCGADDPDRDGYRNAAVNARAGYRFGELGWFDVQWLQTDSLNEYDGSLFAGDESKDRQQVLGGRIALTPVARWTMTLSAGRAWDESRIFFEDQFSSRYRTQRDSLAWQHDIAIADGHQTVLGVDYLQDQVGSSLAYARNSRDNTGVFAEYLGQFGASNAQISLRHDENQQFGGETTGSLAWGYRLPAGLRFAASYGTAFKAPTFNELYFPGFGNPNLEPETSRSLEIGLSGDHRATQWAINLYQTDVDDLIAYDALLWAPANIDRARLRGLEGLLTTRVYDWNLNANLTLLDARNRGASPNNGNLLPRRPEQSIALDLDRRVGRWQVGGSLFFAGRRFDDLANTVKLDPYTLVDVRAEYRFTPSLALQGRLENLFDEDYETTAWYRQPGRSLFVTLRYGP